jgi:hypothetical protein
MTDEIVATPIQVKQPTIPPKYVAVPKINNDTEGGDGSMETGSGPISY